MGRGKELPVQRSKEDKEKQREKVQSMEGVEAEAEAIKEIEREEEEAKKRDAQVKVEVQVEPTKKNMIKTKIAKKVSQEIEVVKRIEVKSIEKPNLKVPVDRGRKKMLRKQAKLKKLERKELLFPEALK